VGEERKVTGKSAVDEYTFPYFCNELDSGIDRIKDFY